MVRCSPEMSSQSTLGLARRVLLGFEAEQLPQFCTAFRLLRFGCSFIPGLTACEGRLRPVLLLPGRFAMWVSTEAAHGAIFSGWAAPGGSRGGLLLVTGLARDALPFGRLRRAGPRS